MDSTDIMRKSRGCLMLLCALTATVGCNEAPAPTPDPVPTASALPQAGTTASTSTGGAPATDPGIAREKLIRGVRFVIPAGWEDAEAKSGFIDAEYRLPGTDGPARLTFSSAGGGVEANLSRWRGQFQRREGDDAEKESTLQVDGVSATMLELFGTFTDGFSGKPPQAASALMGVAIPQGDSLLFVKATGPRATIAARKQEILDLLQTARFRE